MPDIDDINNRIAQTASDGISKVVVRDDEVTVLSIDDQIKAANHVAAQSAASKAHRGLRFTKLVPPGCG